MKSFSEKVIDAVKSIPKGKVASYGQIALVVGVPRGARQVGWVLSNLGRTKTLHTQEVPWWRVVNTEGKITIKGHDYDAPLIQKQLLEQDGVIVSNDFQLDIKKYRFNPQEK